MGTATGRDELRAIARRAMIARGLQPDFPVPALAEADALGDRRVEEGALVRDLRDRPWISIDNDDSRDLDQLSLTEPAACGATRLLVAIADVDTAVSPGGAIDTHARGNTTSVYTAPQVFPMLPERLSTDLTSLAEGQDRLALVVEMTVDTSGAVGRSDLFRALVRNQAKLAYNAVAAWLEGRAPSPGASSAPEVLEQLRLQDGVAQAMTVRRQQRGALTLGLTESRVVFEGDRLVDLRPEPKNRAQELIEDFMIAANVATAHYLERRGFPTLRRVLRSPARWGRIVELAGSYGERLPGEANAPALQAFLDRRRRADPLRFPDLSLAVVKLLGSGEYTVEPPGHRGDGHFGLAVKDYTHSTAPNRRYPDLTTQRLLKAALAGRRSPYTLDELGELAKRCTVQEDNASKVERQVHKSTAALLLSRRLGERFSGVVTGASPKGTWVRLLQPPVEGRVVRGEQGLDVGDRVTVALVDTNVERGFIDFAAANGR